MNSSEDRPQTDNVAGSAAGLDDPRVVEALDEYISAIEAGEKVSRQAFLARRPEIAKALAECLDGLEALHSAASSPRQQAPPSAGVPAAADRLQGTPLGDFQIIREIGRGGMGVVYEAEQLSLGRRVALKVLPFAAALDSKQLQRFKTEAQAAAQLHHTNIVPVYAVGVERGLHFYAMQLIQGTDLAEFIAELRSQETSGRDAPPRRKAESTGPYQPTPPPSNRGIQTQPNLRTRLSTERSERPKNFFRTIARLVAQAADGLDYAHGMGIIHRDVKPANLLVDERANVWLTDFGLAQLHTDVGITQTGDLVGTLRYMSPEQAGGQRFQIDHRTDVYSLGATLYELLTLRPIFDGTDRATLMVQILHEEPRAPRAIDSSIPTELETIALKAVSKSPAERYQTAHEFADDLQRYLRDEPIRARRATFVQRARKWFRRHPSVLVAGVVLLVLLAAGSSVAAWLIRGEQAKTQDAYQRELQRAEEAETRFRLARRSVDQMIQLAEEELADNPQMQSLRRRLLEEALGYYQEFIEQRQDDPDAQAELKETQARVKKIVDDLTVLQGAGHLFLLTDPAVLDDLKPSEEARKHLAELARRMDQQRQESFRDFRQLTQQQLNQRLLDLARANESDVSQILTAEQNRRLNQIALQLQGPSVFRDTDVVAALKLTADQKERIRAIEADTFFGAMESPHGGRGWRDPGKMHREKLNKASERILALLTPAQLGRWKELTGEPFKGPARFFMGAPGRFRPGGPQGPGGGPKPPHGGPDAGHGPDRPGPLGPGTPPAPPP
jgi:serine/threonine protein kinase